MTNELNEEDLLEMQNKLKDILTGAFNKPNTSFTRGHLKAEIHEFIHKCTQERGIYLESEHLKINLEVDKSNKNGLDFEIGNLYTGLLLVGIDCRYRDVKNLKEYETESYKYTFYNGEFIMERKPVTNKAEGTTK